MAFYRCVLRGNEVIDGKECEVEVYIHDTISWTNVRNRAKSCLPMLTKSCVNPIKSMNVVSECDYIKGLVKDPRQEGRIRRLSAVSRIFERDGHQEIVSEDGLMLKRLCSKFRQADEKEQANLQKKYLHWANKLMLETSNNAGVGLNK